MYRPTSQCVYQPSSQPSAPSSRTTAPSAAASSISRHETLAANVHSDPTARHGNDRKLRLSVADQTCAAQCSILIRQRLSWQREDGGSWVRLGSARSRLSLGSSRLGSARPRLGPARPQLGPARPQLGPSSARLGPSSAPARPGSAPAADRTDSGGR